MLFDLVDILRLGFLGATAAVLLLYPLPSLRSRFLAYGARATPSTATEAEKTEAKSRTTPVDNGALANFLDYLASLKVAHNYFTSFYWTSVTLCLVWLLDYALGFPLASHMLFPHISPDRPSTPFHRAILTWLALTIQGCRRLYESHAFASPSSAKMWFGHWALGILFYAFLSVSVWIEGLPALRTHHFSIADLSIQAPTLQTLSCLSLFALASGIQHDAHAYLHALKTRPFSELHPNLTNTSSPPGAASSTYKLPQHPAFHRTLTPHYFAECLIYVSWMFLAAPEGRWVNGTVGCAAVFVVGNLGVTAQGTREWYVQRFGRRAIEGRAKMVPFVW